MDALKPCGERPCRILAHNTRKELEEAGHATTQQNDRNGIPPVLRRNLIINETAVISVHISSNFR